LVDHVELIHETYHQIQHFFAYVLDESFGSFYNIFFCSTGKILSDIDSFDVAVAVLVHVCRKRSNSGWRHKEKNST